MSVSRLLSLVAALSVGFLLFAGAASAARYDDDSVIVKYRPGSSKPALASLLERAGVTGTVESLAGVRADVLRVKDDPAEVARRLNRSPLVFYAEPNFVMRTLAVPNDARFGDLYGLDNAGQTGGSPDADIDAPEGWDLAGLGAFPTSGGVKVGIVDTGIDQGHEDLSGKTVACAESRLPLDLAGLGDLLGPVLRLLLPNQLREGSCPDLLGHGTHVAGTIAAKANNGVGVAGVAFNAPLVVCGAFDAQGAGLTSDIVNCIDWAHSKGAKVISMSFGGPDSTTLHTAVQNAWAGGGANGSVLLAAAGNSGAPVVSYPAGYAEVVSVGATDNRDRKAVFSNTNADVEVAAPGVNVLSANSGGGYVGMSGTSMATPHASGVAAVIWQLSPGATASSVRNRLDAAVDDLGTPGRDTSFGFGRVNLCKAAGGSCAYTGGG